jgi:hypothetical protein
VVDVLRLVFRFFNPPKSRHVAPVPSISSYVLGDRSRIGSERKRSTQLDTEKNSSNILHGGCGLKGHINSTHEGKILGLFQENEGKPCAGDWVVLNWRPNFQFSCLPST